VVPWRRLFIEWVVIGAVVVVISLVVTKNRSLSSYLTVLFGGLVYVGFGAVLAKFGYARKTLAQMRTEAAAAPPRRSGSTSSSSASKPAPTRRTSTGPSQRPTKKKR
jgi:amino acid permease